MPDDHLSAPTRNRLLAKLPGDELRHLLPALKLIELKPHQVLYEQYGPIKDAYFPIGAAMSALNLMEDGSIIEVATIGNEGLVGHTAVGDDRYSPNRVIAQIGGPCYQVEAATLRDQVVRNPGLRKLLGSYTTAYMAQVSQSVACNGLHRLEQRCCRWLLMSRDRVGSNDLHLTHEFLAIMLGSRRASVTELIRPLQDAGLIRTHRGLISILDGPGLEDRCCECYQVVREAYDRILGRPAWPRYQAGEGGTEYDFNN